MYCSTGLHRTCKLSGINGQQAFQGAGKISEGGKINGKENFWSRHNQ